MKRTGLQKIIYTDEQTIYDANSLGCHPNGFSLKEPHYIHEGIKHVAHFVQLKNCDCKFIFICLLLYTSVVCRAQNMPNTYADYTFGKLEYGLFVPENYDSSKSYPLVMYLHGWSNNYTVYLNFYNKDIQLNNPCFVYTPKTPTDWGDWSSWSWEGTGFSSLSVPTQTAMNVLDSLISKYSIDPNRLYVYGISMGGEGVFDLLHKMPHKFAAGISICGGGFAHWAEKISFTPLWMFHGSADDINPPDITERVVNKLQEIGATKMRYTNYPGYGHAIWDKAQSEPSFYDWMFAFDKSKTDYTPPKGNIILSGTVNDKINLHWNDIRNELDSTDKIWYYNVFNSSGLIATVEHNVTNYSFKPTSNIDTFNVQAVNYWFQKSGFSNSFYFENGQLSTPFPGSIDKKKVNVTNNKGLLFIDVLRESASPVYVQLVSLEGKVLFAEKYQTTNQIVLDISSYNKAFFMLNVIVDNRSYVQKVISNHLK
jgi:predicted esterase